MADVMEGAVCCGELWQGIYGTIVKTEGDCEVSGSSSGMSGFGVAGRWVATKRAPNAWVIPGLCITWSIFICMRG